MGGQAFSGGESAGQGGKKSRLEDGGQPVLARHSGDCTSCHRWPGSAGLNALATTAMHVPLSQPQADISLHREARVNRAWAQVHLLQSGTLARSTPL